MPVIRYTLRVEGEDEPFQETETFPAQPITDPEEIVRKIIVEPLNKRRETLSDKPLILVGVSVLNPFLHAHSWKRYKVCKYALKAYYECEQCGITAYRITTLFEGEKGGMNRDEAYKNKKFELCHDVLKALPKTISFG
jgi:hypothetical protein